MTAEFRMMSCSGRDGLPISWRYVLFSCCERPSLRNQPTTPYVVHGLYERGQPGWARWRWWFARADADFPTGCNNWVLTSSSSWGDTCVQPELDDLCPGCFDNNRHFHPFRFQEEKSKLSIKIWFILLLYKKKRDPALATSRFFQFLFHVVQMGNDRNAFNFLPACVSHILKTVKTVRIVLGILAIIPIYLIADSVSRPATYGEVTLSELTYLVIGTPILILNLWAWIEPEIIEQYFPSIKNHSK